MYILIFLGIFSLIWGNVFMFVFGKDPTILGARGFFIGALNMACGYIALCLGIMLHAIK
jgi:hypothetical protein